MHAIYLSSAALAGMSPLSEGGGGSASSDVQGSATRGEAPGPIGNQFASSAPLFRGGGAQEREERQSRSTGPTSPKKRKVDVSSAPSRQEHSCLQEIEHAIAKALHGLPGPDAATGCGDGVRALREEVQEIKNVQLQLV